MQINYNLLLIPYGLYLKKEATKQIIFAAEYLTFQIVDRLIFLPLSCKLFYILLCDP